MWSRKHEEFCLKENLPPAARLMWRWLIETEKIGEESEPDLNEFNKWVKRHRSKGYCRPYLKKCFQHLIESRVITVIRQFTWRIFRVIIRPLEWLLPPKQNLPTRSKSCGFKPSNPQSSKTEEKQQQHRNSISQMCESSGVPVTENAINRLTKFALEEIEQAIWLFKERGGLEKISNPVGWLIECCRGSWWEDYHV